MLSFIDVRLDIFGLAFRPCTFVCQSVLIFGLSLDMSETPPFILHEVRVPYFLKKRFDPKGCKQPSFSGRVPKISYSTKSHCLQATEDPCILDFW